MAGIPSVQTALEGVPTSRVQRLVKRLEADPEIKVTVCGWWPQCPMSLAGYERRHSAAECAFGPEHRFAVAWDHFAQRENRRWWHAILKTPHQARRCDVQALLRMANETLASRGSPRDSGLPSQPPLVPVPPASSRVSAAVVPVADRCPQRTEHGHS